MAKRTKLPGFLTIDAKSAARLITFFGILAAIFLTVFVWVIYQPGRHKHTHLVNERTKMRLTFQPAIIQDYITSLAPGITRFVSNVPKFTSMQARAFRVDWIHALPYEITFLAGQDSPTQVPLTVYVNPIPDNDSFVGEVNGWGALGRIPVIKWEGGRLMPAGEQQHTAKGAVPVGVNVASEIESWPLGAGSLAPFKGAHFIDFAVDNSNGILLALHAAFRNHLFTWTSAETEEELHLLWPQIARAHVLGDLTRDDEITFEITIVGTNALDQLAAGASIDNALNELGYFLSESEGVNFLGSGKWINSLTYQATYQLTGFEAKIKRIWRD